MNKRIGNILLYLLLGFLAIRYGIPIIIRLVGAIFGLVFGVVGLGFGIIGLVFGLIFTVVPLIIIGWVIYNFLLKKKNNNSN